MFGEAKGLEKINSSFVSLIRGGSPMNLSSPFIVVAAIVIVFVIAILFATNTKEDGHEKH